MDTIASRSAQSSLKYNDDISSMSLFLFKYWLKCSHRTDEAAASSLSVGASPSHQARLSILYHRVRKAILAAAVYSKIA